MSQELLEQGCYIVKLNSKRFGAANGQQCRVQYSEGTFYMVYTHQQVTTRECVVVRQLKDSEVNVIKRNRGML